MEPRELLDSAKQCLNSLQVALQLFEDDVQHDPISALTAMLDTTTTGVFNFKHNAKDDTGLTRLRDMCIVHQTERKICTRGARRVEIKEHKPTFLKDISFGNDIVIGERDDLRHLQSPNVTKDLQSTIETVDNGNKWGTCEAYQTTLTLQNPLPEILVVPIKRVVYDKWQKEAVKVMTALNFDEDMVINNTQYKLHAVILHEGKNPFKGHYVSRVLKGDGWHECNDTTVLPVWGPSDTSQGGRQITMLFYAKA